MAESSHLSVNPATERFHQYDLDDRLLKGISDLGWSAPTLIQSEAIPLVLEGKDLLARARTGSGKTGAYAIPVIQKILATKKASSSSTGACGTKALVLAPSKELCQQTAQVLKDLSTHCTRDVRISDMSCITPSTTHRSKQEAGPDIVVATPAKAVAHVTAKSLQLKASLEMLVVDEADLTFSYGFEEDMRRLLPHLPRIHQAILMSATLSADVVTLKKLVLHNPVTLKLEEPDLPQSSQLSQYHVKCSADDKFLLLYALLKLKLVRGKTLMFVNSIDRCYQLKLFLEQFGIPACVLNSELPHNSRLHIVAEFNRGVYDYVIATDEAHGLAMSTQPSKHKSAAVQKSKESGAARGIDFQGVENVVNVDFPPSPAAYVHRVGRTARGDKVGTSLSLVAPSEEELLQRTESQFTGGAVNESPVIVKPYKFKMSELEGLRYRVRDAMKAVSKSAVKEARLKEIRMEVINSDKLKVFFEDNPRDLQVLRHDKVLQPKRVQPHLKHVPSYLVPKELKRSAVDVGGVSRAKQPRAAFSSQRKRRGKGKGPANDPLKTFAYH